MKCGRFPSLRQAERRARPAAGHSFVASAAALAIQSCDESVALPQLARLPVQFLSRRLDRSFVVVGFEPFAGRDLAYAIEAVKPV